MPKLPSRTIALPETPEPVPAVNPRLDLGARTDRGRVRENNEDSLRIAPDLNLFVLSDGMGGQASGEIASHIATDAIADYCRAAGQDSPPSAECLPGLSETSGRLVAAVHRANSAIRDAARDNPQWQGMGATIVVAQLQGDRMSLAHVGDSRAYRLRSGGLEQLTNDHSFVAEQVRRGVLTQEEAAQSTLQNVLLRALGQEPQVEIDISEELVLDRDVILLCSDGLTREVTDTQIANILADTGDAQTAADRLVEAANQAGGEDNITVIVLRPGGKRDGTFARIGRWTERMVRRSGTCRSSF
jgi:PPM family protein phosphatase